MTFRLHRSILFWTGLLGLACLLTCWFGTRTSGRSIRAGNYVAFIGGNQVLMIDTGALWSWKFDLQPYKPGGVLPIEEFHYRQEQFEMAGGRTATRRLYLLPIWFITALYTFAWLALLLWLWRRFVRFRRQMLATLAEIPDHESTPPTV